MSDKATLADRADVREITIRKRMLIALSMLRAGPELSQKTNLGKGDRHNCMFSSSTFLRERKRKKEKKKKKKKAMFFCFFLFSKHNCEYPSEVVGSRSWAVSVH